MSEAGRPDNQLGAYLRDRRARLDPAAFGFPGSRRRTAGLRREEVAQLANISPTWYTWLEQGRGGAPSADVLERIARALMLTDDEREHMFLIGRGHPPERHYRRDHSVTPRLQRVLNALEPNAALIRTAIWDVVAWNRAAEVLLSDYAGKQPHERNILRTIFLDPRSRAAQQDWESVARFVIASFKIDAMRAGATDEVAPLVEELSRLSPEFRALWGEHDVPGPVEGLKRIRHPVLGPISFEFSAFGVDARPDLTMVVYSPVDPTDADRIRAIIAERERAKSA